MTTIFDGVGIYSIAQMEAAAARSPWVGPLPLLFMTSGLRDVPAPYHGTGNATDWGDNADQVKGSPQMDGFAAWLAEHYGPWSLEIIHVNMNGTTVEWKNGARQPTGFYGWDTLDEHRGHVHWAITQAGLAMAPTPLPQPSGDDIVATLRTINANLNNPLNMQDPLIRTAQGLLEARGGMITPANSDHGLFYRNVIQFQKNAHLKQDGYVGQTTWDALVGSIKLPNGKVV